MDWYYSNGICPIASIRLETMEQAPSEIQSLYSHKIFQRTQKSFDIMEEKQKYGLRIINAELFDLSPNRYELRKGTQPDAPLCPFGNQFQWIGFDKEKMQYVRVTKSVFKKLIKSK